MRHKFVFRTLVPHLCSLHSRILPQTSDPLLFCAGGAGLHEALGVCLSARNPFQEGLSSQGPGPGASQLALGPAGLALGPAGP